jgi:Predicted transcriptional regulators
MPHPNAERKVREMRADVARRLRVARADKRLSQADVAKAAGTSRVTVSELENEVADPRITTLARIAGVLDLTLTVGSAA